VATNLIFLPNKLNFCCGNYSREATIQKQKLFSGNTGGFELINIEGKHPYIVLTSPAY
jgi:hypothetical protein